MVNLEGYEGPRYKIVVIGDGAVGKTSILERLLGREFHSTYKLTIGANIITKEVTFEGILFKYQLWDMAGQKRFSIVRSSYYRGAHAAILCFDLNWAASFESLPRWKDELESHLGRSIPFVLVGNKNDLPPQVSETKITQYISSANADLPCTVPYMPTSAKTGENISEILTTIAKLLITYKAAAISK